MKHDAIGGFGRNACDGIAETRRARVVVAGHHNTESRSRIPINGCLVERAIDAMLKDRHEIAANTHHDGLCFRVTHPAVEFEYFNRTVRFMTVADHQAGI